MEGAPASQGPQSSASLLTVAQLRAVPATGAEVGPPALASTRRSSLRGIRPGVQVDRAAEHLGPVPAAFRPRLPSCCLSAAE